MDFLSQLPSVLEFLLPWIQIQNSRFQRFSNPHFLFFQIVYHRGEDVSDGHYVTEFNHPSLGWLHCDKGVMNSIRPQRLRNSVPYILFYQNIDTLLIDPNSPTLKIQDQLKKIPKTMTAPVTSLAEPMSFAVSIYKVCTPLCFQRLHLLAGMFNF